MAVTYLTEPENYGRVYDTNRLMYKMSSPNYSQVNFRYYITLWAALDHNSYTQIATVRKRPLTDGTCFFNPAEIYASYMGSDLEINITGLTEALSSNYPFRLITKEEYGDPPTIQSAGTTSDLRLYNGLQEYIPYDITAYGGGNGQWLMSGISYDIGWLDLGDWWIRDNNFQDRNIYYPDVTTLGITGLTTIQVAWDDKDGVDRMAGLNHITPGDYVKFQNASNPNEAFVFTFSTATPFSSGVTWTGYNYTTKTSAMQLTGFTKGSVITIYHANYDTGEGYGKFLTDALDWQVDTWDYANLYFLCTTANRPPYVRVKVNYWGIPGYEEDEEIGIGNVTDNARQLMTGVNVGISTTNPPYSTNDKPEPNETIPPVFKPQISSYYTGYTLSPYTTSANNMYYFPTGPVELAAKGIFNKAGDKWVSYQIDLTDGLDGAAKLYNKYPQYYYRKCKQTKYDPLQVFWLNPHGGFDRYTFYLKNYIEYGVERTRWQHRFSDTYVLGERGITVYKTKANQKIILNTDYLTASEAQILAQLMLSPEVYLAYEYKSKVYKIPYVVIDSDFQYKDIKNEKMVTMQIEIEPAWARVSQTS